MFAVNGQIIDPCMKLLYRAGIGPQIIDEISARLIFGSELIQF